MVPKFRVFGSKMTKMGVDLASLDGFSGKESKGGSFLDF